MYFEGLGFRSAVKLPLKSGPNVQAEIFSGLMWP